jgi:hypothetical protein
MNPYPASQSKKNLKWRCFAVVPVHAKSRRSWACLARDFGRLCFAFEQELQW